MSEPRMNASAGTREHKGSWSQRTRARRYEWMRSYGPAFSGMGGIVTAIAFFWVVLGQFEKNTAIQALLDSNKGPQAFIALHCLTALDKLDNDKLLNLHNREEILLTDIQETWIIRCFADKEIDDNKLVIKSTSASKSEAKLTKMGTALLAERANHVVDRDQLVALLRVEGVMYRGLMFPEQHYRICTLDKFLFEKTRDIGRTANIDPASIADWKQEFGGFPKYFTKFCRESTQPEIWEGRYMQF